MKTFGREDLNHRWFSISLLIEVNNNKTLQYKQTKQQRHNKTQMKPETVVQVHIFLAMKVRPSQMMIVHI